MLKLTSLKYETTPKLTFKTHSIFKFSSLKNYYLKISRTDFTGDLPEYLVHTHNGKMFTTRDSDNDLRVDDNCASLYTGKLATILQLLQLHRFYRRDTESIVYDNLIIIL